MASIIAGDGASRGLSGWGKTGPTDTSAAPSAGVGGMSPASTGMVTSGLGGVSTSQGDDAQGTVVPSTPATGPGSMSYAGPAPSSVAARFSTPAAQPDEPRFYGMNANQTLGEFKQWQSDEFNRNQLAAQGQYNAALGQMPYNTQIGAVNPYDQYVANPASPGQGSAAFQSPANQAAWQNSGLASQLADPTTGFAQSRPGNADYGNNQLMFLLNTLQRYGQGGQNRFGNTFNPLFTNGSPNSSSNLNGLGNSSSNPGGYQSGLGGGSNFDLGQLLPILLGLARNNSAGSYGNLG